MNSHTTSTLDNVRVVELEQHHNRFGNLSVVPNGQNSPIPFDIKRIFYLYDVPAGSVRGGHSHHQGQELIVAVSGAFEVELDDGTRKQRWRLDRPYQGLYIPTGIWRVIDNFSGGAVCLVLTSTEYTEADYVRDYAEFLKLTSTKRK